MKKIISSIATTGTILFAPFIALAQPSDNFGEIGDTAGSVIGFINSTLIPLVFAVALLVFIWGMFRFFILGGHDSDKQKEGKDLMIWATVGFVLMVSIFGIVNLIAGGFGFTDESIDDNIPTAPSTR